MDHTIPMNTVDGRYFDTYNTITAPCERALLQEAMDQCRFYNDLLSKTVPGSDVWNCNHAEGAPVDVSGHTERILALALEMHRNSGGAFNIAIGSAANLWHFTDGTAILPDAEKLAAAVARADCSQIRLEGSQVTMPPETQIDLGGIAKGYIADRIADYLRERGVASALLNFGGNIVTVGNRPDGKPWSVGLQTPGAERGKKYWAYVPCSDGTLVTSGIYERSFEKDGVIYHHILDPRTGWPVQNNVLTVTAVAKDSLLADAITTALFVLGPENGFKLARYYGVQAVYFLRDGEIRYSPELELTFVKG